MLPFIIERKGGGDLASSIKDGRWTRQHRSMTQLWEGLDGGRGTATRDAAGAAAAGAAGAAGAGMGMEAGMGAGMEVGRISMIPMIPAWERIYIIEGGVNHSFRCPCGCAGVGGCEKGGWPSKARLEDELREREGEVERMIITQDWQHTARTLAE